MNICVNCKHVRYHERSTDCDLTRRINPVHGNSDFTKCSDVNTNGKCPDFEQKPEEIGFLKRLWSRINE